MVAGQQEGNGMFLLFFLSHVSSCPVDSYSLSESNLTNNSCFSSFVHASSLGQLQCKKTKVKPECQRLHSVAFDHQFSTSAWGIGSNCFLALQPPFCGVRSRYQIVAGSFIGLHMLLDVDDTSLPHWPGSPHMSPLLMPNISCPLFVPDVIGLRDCILYKIIF